MKKSLESLEKFNLDLVSTSKVEGGAIDTGAGSRAGVSYTCDVSWLNEDLTWGHIGYTKAGGYDCCIIRPSGEDTSDRFISKDLFASEDLNKRFIAEEEFNFFN